MKDTAARVAPSTQISPQLDELKAVQRISDHGWWQGAVIDTEAFKSELPQLASSRLWILISQTCNLFNPSFEKVPSVEFIAAKEVDSLDSQLARGFNPRVLHTKADDGQSNELILEIQIQNRQWVPREALALVPPAGKAVRDLNGDPEGRFKEVLATWVARSYTRIELPDALNLAIQKSDLHKVLRKISKIDEGLYGIFFFVTTHQDGDLEDDGARDPEPMSPSEVAHSKGPWDIEISVVCYNQKARARAIEILDSADELRYPPVGGSATEKRSIRQLAAAEGLHVVGMQAVTDDAWRVPDLMSTLRYTNFDYQSGADESDL